MDRSKTQNIALVLPGAVVLAIIATFPTPALPAQFLAFLMVATPLLAAHPVAARFAFLPLFLGSFAIAAPSWLGYASAAVLLLALLPPKLLWIASLTSSLTLAWSAFGTIPTAFYVGALAAVVSVLVATAYNRRSVLLLAASFALSAVLLFSVPMLAFASALSTATAVSLSAAIVLVAALALSLKSSSPAPRLLALPAALLLLTLPSAFAVETADGETGSAGVLASSTILECPNLGSDTIKSVECYSTGLIDEFRTNGLENALRLVDELYGAPGSLGSHFASNCHESLHFLGKATALSDGGELRAVIAKGTDKCAAGFGHGVWEMEYGAMPTDELVKQVPTICRGWEGYNRSEEGSAGIGCRHILGHTLATRYRSHIEDVAPVCLVRDPIADPASELTQDETIAQNNCLAGLFMENFLDLNRFRTADIDNNNPFKTCEHEKIAADARLMWGCYNEIGAMVVPWYDYDMNAALKACRAQAEKFNIPEYVKLSCYDSIARSMSPALENNMQELEKACSTVEEGELKTYCVKGIAASTAFDSNQIDVAYQICERNLTDPASLEVCRQRVDEIARSLDASKVAADGSPKPTSSPGAP